MKRIILILLINILCMRLTHAQNFFQLPPGFNSIVSTLFYDSSTNLLYAGGNFWKLSDNFVSMNHISRWNGIEWDSLGSGLFGNVNSIVKYNGFIYAGGSFSIKDSAGNYIYPANISYWDGSYWRLPPGGASANNVVWSLFADGNDLYVAGIFDTINGMYAHGIARYDGTQWYSYPQFPFGFNAYVFDAVTYNGDLHVAGDFNAGFGLQDIVRFDGTSWVTVGGGLPGFNSFVQTMCVHQGELYVVGDFDVSFGDPGNCIAKWNGSSWSSLGAGLNMGGQLFDITVFKNEIYVGGNFSSISGTASPFIAKWDGSNWNSLGSIFNNGVAGFASHGNDLYIGGGFITVGNDSMMRITRYSPPLTLEENLLSTIGITIYPIPNSGNFFLTSLFYPIESIRLFDLSGRVIFSEHKIFSNTYQCKLNVPDGIYIAEVKVKEEIYREKVEVVR